MIVKNKQKTKVFQINSLSDLLERLKQDIDVDDEHWFRGQSKSSWRLLPSLAREQKNLEKETDLLARFKQNAALLLPNLPQTEWEWVTIMQHHGVPTRLLDWTESPLMGLYFAVGSNYEDNGALWVLRPTALNAVSQITPDYPRYIPNFEDDPLGNYAPTALASEKFSRLNPIAVIGPRNTPRMQAQLGVFTVIHRDPIAIEDVADGSHVWKYEIPCIAKKEIRKELSIIGIRKFQLFPELQTLGEILGEL